MNITPLLQARPDATTREPRLLTHYFGVQLQALRYGPWKLIVPINQLPTLRMPSIWFEHQPGLFERQHRLWPKAVLYNLEDDPSETTDLAEQHPKVVERLLDMARSFDAAFQNQIQPMEPLAGPKPPEPGGVRTEQDDLGAWLDLIR
jgi:hypothetical protein